MAWSGAVRPGQDLSSLLVESAVLLAAGLVVPLGARALTEAPRDGAPPPPDRVPWLRGGALALVAALLAPRGPLALALAIPWVLATLAQALDGARRLAERPRRDPTAVAADLAKLYLPVGALWIAAYVGDVPVMGFAGLQALLTAVHFHYAGFGACAVAALLGRDLDDDPRAPRWVRAAQGLGAAGMCLGIPLLAAGITGARALEHAAGWNVAASTALLGLVALQRAGASLPGALLALSGASAMVSSALAFDFARGGFAALTAEGLQRMVRYHGAVNALGFVGCATLAMSLRAPRGRAAPPGLPLSRLRARGYVGAGFFEREGVAAQGDARGLMDDLDAYARDGFDPSSVSEAVRDFYERTARWTLVVAPGWRPGWRWAGRVWQGLARRMGQLNLPWHPRSLARAVSSRMVPLRAEVDGRERPRGWVRTYAAEGDAEPEPIYVAAYSSHAREGVRYMNIAFPLPGCNLTSALRMDARAQGGVSLSTLATRRGRRDGDQGVYLVTRWGALRLPLDETIEVWDASLDAGWEARLAPPEGVRAEDVAVLATHDMWLLGMRYTRLVYFLSRAAEG